MYAVKLICYLSSYVNMQTNILIQTNKWKKTIYILDSRYLLYAVVTSNSNNLSMCFKSEFYDFYISIMSLFSINVCSIDRKCKLFLFTIPFFFLL